MVVTSSFGTGQLLARGSCGSLSLLVDVNVMFSLQFCLCRGCAQALSNSSILVWEGLAVERSSGMQLVPACVSARSGAPLPGLVKKAGCRSRRASAL